jgi:DNA-binding response OmpR family regulator
MNNLAYTEHAARLLILDGRPPPTNLTQYLRAANLHVDCARDLNEAEALTTSNYYDLVILDVRRSDGCAADVEAMERLIRLQPRETDVMLIAESRALEAGAVQLRTFALLEDPAPAEIAAIVLKALGQHV